MMTRPRFERVFCTAAVLFVWMSLPLLDKPVDSHADPPVSLTTYRLRMGSPKVITDCCVGDPYAMSPTVRPTVVFGPSFQPPDRLDATPHDSSAIEIWFRWFFPWPGSDLKDPEQLHRR